MSDATGFLGTSAEATPAPAPGADAAPKSYVTGSGASIQFPEGIDEEIKVEGSFKAFINETDGKINFANLMKSYVHQGRLIGKDKVVIPGKNGTDQEWQEVFHKLGLPKDLNEYKLENKVPEGVTPNENFLKAFSEAAHKNGIIPKQAQAMLDFYNGMIGESVKNSKTQEAAAEAAEVAALKKEWGMDFDKKVSQATEALGLFADDDTKKYMGEIGLMKDAKMVKMFAKIGESLAGDSIFRQDSKGSFGLGADDINAQITKMHAPDSPLKNKMHPDHQKSMAAYEQLLNKLGQLKQNSGV